MNLKKLWICIFILLVCIILLYSPYLWKYNLAANADILYQDIPLRALAAKIWRQGQIPLWNPYNFTGQPIGALLHAGIFYPPNILYCFFNPILAHKLLIILSLWWLGIGFLIWALQQRFSSLVAFSLALISIYQPINLFEILPIRDTIIWLPWMLWAADKLVLNEEKYLKNIIINSLIWSLSFLAGFTQFWVYLMITLMCYVIFQKGWKKQWLYVIIITLLFISPQILLTIPYYLNSLRNTTNFCKANLSLPSLKQIFNTFLSFTIPFNSSLPDYKVFYFSPLIFSASLSILFLKSPSLRLYRLFFLIILLISILLAFTMLPCYIPYINSFRLHQRFFQSILPYIILISAAAFFDYWYKNKKGFKIFLISILSLLILSLIISLWLHKVNENLLLISNSLDYFLIAIIFLLALKKLTNPFFMKIAVILLVILISVQYKFAYNKWLSDPPFRHFACNSWDENLNNYKKIKSIINKNKIYIIFPPLPDAKSGLEPLLNTVNAKYQINFIGDVFMSDIKKNLRNLFGFYPKIWSLFGVRNYIEPFSSMKFYENNKLKFAPDFSFENKIEREVMVTKDKRAFSLLTIHKFLENDENWRIKKIMSDPNIVIYEYKGKVFPDAWLINKTLLVNEEKKFLDLLITKPINYWEAFGIVHDEGRVYSFKKDEKAKVFIDKWEAHNILIRVNASRYQILVIRLYPYACWGAKIDNEKAELFPVNYVMQGIVIPAGDHRIQLACNFLNIIASITAKITK